MKTPYQIVLILSLFVFAQQTAAKEWLKSYGSVEHDYYSYSAKDADGNLYVATPISATTDFNPNPNVSATVSITGDTIDAIAISKFDATGKFIWVKSLTSKSDLKVTAMSIDTNGNIYFGGYFSTDYDETHKTDFNPDPTKEALLFPTPYTFIDDIGKTQTTYFQDAFVCKWDKDGNFVWVKQFRGSIGEQITQILIDNATNSLYVSGRFWGGVNQANVDANPDENAEAMMNQLSDYTAAFITKLNLDGNYVWSAQLDGSKGSYLTRTSMGVDDAHNFYFAGTALNNVDVNPGVEVVNALGDFILKWDANKNFIWAKSFGSTNVSKQVGAMGVDKKTGDVYVSGMYANTIQCAPGAETLKSNGSWDVYFAKFSTNGDYLWSKSWGSDMSDECLTLAVDEFDHVIVGGEFQKKVDFDHGVAEHFITSAGQHDAFINIYTKNGDYVTTKTVGGMGSDWVHSITPLSDGGLFVTGGFSFAATSGASSVDAVGGYDIWMLKTDAIETGINETRLDANISLFPNPTQGQTLINLNKEYSDITVTVRNVLGAEISNNNYRNVSKISLNLQGESGLYFVDLKDNNGKLQTLKVVKR